MDMNLNGKNPGSPTGQMVSGNQAAQVEPARSMDNGDGIREIGHAGDNRNVIKDRSDAGPVHNSVRLLQKSLATQHTGTGVASLAPATPKPTSAETVVPSGTQRNPAPDGDLIANMGTGPELITRAAQRKVIDIGALSEDELLCKLRGYINSMCAFAQGTRNVHKELKETLANSNKIMVQYVKVLRQGRNNDLKAKEYRSAHTQTQEYTHTSLYKKHIVSAASVSENTVPTPLDLAHGELPACIEVLRDIMISQGEAVGKLAEQVERIQLQQQQLQQQQRTAPPRQQVKQEPLKSKKSQSNQEQEVKSTEQITKRQA